MPSWLHTLRCAIEEGGYPMYLLVFVHVATLSLFVRRASVLVRARWGSHRVADEVVRVLRGTASVDHAFRLRGLARTPVGRILFVGLLHGNRAPAQAAMAMDAARQDEVSRLRRGTGSLKLAASVSVLVGFYGTLIGMVGRHSSNADAMTRAAAIAGAIAESFSCTALGLYTALFPLLAFALLTTHTTRTIAELDRGRMQLLATLTELAPALRLYGTRPPHEPRSYREPGA